MSAGPRRYQHRLTFDEPTPASNGMGGKKKGWTEDVFTRRGNYQRLSGGEKVQSDRASGVKSTVITVRADAVTRALTNAWRIRDRSTGETFNVQTVTENTGRREVELLCASGVPIGGQK